MGEILVKYHPNANNDIVSIIEKEGGEAVVPDLSGLSSCTVCKNSDFNYEVMAGSYSMHDDIPRGHRRLSIPLPGCHMPETLEKSRRFDTSSSISIKSRIRRMTVTSLGTQCGEGWLLAGEMAELDHAVCRKYRLPAAVRLPAESRYGQGA